MGLTPPPGLNNVQKNRRFGPEGRPLSVLIHEVDNVTLFRSWFQAMSEAPTSSFSWSGKRLAGSRCCPQTSASHFSLAQSFFFGEVFSLRATCFTFVFSYVFTFLPEDIRAGDVLVSIPLEALVTR